MKAEWFGSQIKTEWALDTQTPNPSVKRTLHGLPEFMRKKPRINSVNPFRAAYLTR